MALTKSEIETLIKLNIYGDPVLGKRLHKLITTLPKDLLDKMHRLESGNRVVGDVEWSIDFSREKCQLNIERKYYKPNEQYVEYTEGFVLDNFVPQDDRFDYQTKYYEIQDDFMKIDLEDKGTKTTSYIVSKVFLGKKSTSITYSAKVDYIDESWKEVEDYNYDGKTAMIDFKRGNTAVYSKDRNNVMIIDFKTGKTEHLDLSNTKKGKGHDF